MTGEALLEAARRAAERAYAPYSGFRVGAAVLAEGRVYLGCNVENASYPAGICAERTAVSSAVADGKRRLEAVAIVGRLDGEDGPGDETFPCGICRQVLREFGDASLPVYLEDRTGAVHRYRLGDLLPHAFGPEALPGQDGARDETEHHGDHGADR